jgi:hypothetical protein
MRAIITDLVYLCFPVHIHTFLNWCAISFSVRPVQDRSYVWLGMCLSSKFGLDLLARAMRLASSFSTRGSQLLTLPSFPLAGLVASFAAVKGARMMEKIPQRSLSSIKRRSVQAWHKHQSLNGSRYHRWRANSLLCTRIPLDLLCDDSKGDAVKDC